MDAKTLEALKASIAKWERNTEAKQVREYRLGISECPLCQLFNPGVVTRKRDCGGCPVAEKTGARYCNKTPYDRTEDAYWLWLEAPLSAEKCVSAQEAAQAELTFLKSLLPSEED